MYCGFFFTPVWIPENIYINKRLNSGENMIHRFKLHPNRSKTNIKEMAHKYWEWAQMHVPIENKNPK